MSPKPKVKLSTIHAQNYANQWTKLITHTINLNITYSRSNQCQEAPLLSIWRFGETFEYKQQYTACWNP